MEAPISAHKDSADHSLPLPSLRILAPPMRLVSAAMWKVVQRKDVLHYGKLEEFVTSVSEMVPGLLSYRHRAKLALGLQARLILELCRSQDPPDPRLILPHLDRIKPPAHRGKRDAKVEKSTANFRELVETLLKNPAGRKRFFQEEFPIEYGPQFDTALEKLLWEFLSRLDQLLPVPDLAQTVSWLCAAPAVLEECAKSVSQPQLLRTLLQHQKRLGHVDTLASLPSTLGDSILSSLSLPPSGRAQNTNQETDSSGQTETRRDAVIPSSLTHPPNRRRGRTPPVTPVIGLISSKDLPVMASAGRGRRSAAATPAPSEGAGSGSGGDVPCYTGVRLRPRRDLNTSGEEGAKRMLQRGGVQEAKRRQSRKKDTGARRWRRGEERERGWQEGEDPCPLVMSCLQRQPKVLINRLSFTDITLPVVSLPRPPSGGGRSPWRQDTPPEARGARSPRQAGRVSTRKRKFGLMATPRKELSDSSEKENCADSPVTWTASPVLSTRTQHRGRASCPDGDDDIIIDSEDEEIKNFKGKLFVKQYYRTKHNTFVPTLREFWSPGLPPRGPLSPCDGHS
ncbi:TERF1-interacting nuclear factor 2 [Megalops cyprinoides]|uniref:TERF1-interacting nuclear factor 2 n=1 Tax=Megalops cyprinoides TaxID=118141 RepID=UPI001864F7F4|nr:TERF1-interacting nuclear factor 2 [Megalops cyprinoides]